MLFQKKIVLITGASKGIGEATAKAFIKEGAHVLILARSISKLESIDDYAQINNTNTTIIPLDLTDFIKIDELARVIAQKFGRIDILIGNAAAFDKLTPITHIENESWQKTIDINLTANWRLLKAMEPLLQASTNPRVIYVTSEVGKNYTPYWGAYAVSKAALEAMVEIYAKETTIKNIKVTLIDPGKVDTDIRRKAMPGEDKSKLKNPKDVVNLFFQSALEGIDLDDTNNCLPNYQKELV